MMVMRNLVLLIIIMLITGGEVFSFAIKVYDEYGNRVGTYRRVGDSYEFYDFYDRKVEKAEDIIKNAPSQNTLKEVGTRIYNPDMMPLDSYSSNLYGTYWRNYPRRFIRPQYVNSPRAPYIVRPRARDIFPHSRMQYSGNLH